MKSTAMVARYSGVANAIMVSSSVALALYLLRSVATGSAQFSFMAWNLVLSFLALVFSCLALLAAHTQQRFRIIVPLLVLWLLFLPNTFYMITDYLHVTDSGAINYLFDIVLIGCFAMNGFLHGLLSLRLVHNVVRRYVSTIASWCVIEFCILAASFAVDMGRFMRWNSWDVITRPKSLLFDVTDIMLNPSQYNRSLLITGVFFVMISSFYAVAWQAAKVQWGSYAKS